MHKQLSFSNIVLVTLFVAASCLPAGKAHADVKSELHIGADGVLTAKNLTVMQKSENGSSFFVRALWDSVFLRLTVLATPSGVAAPITKNNGGKATYQDVQVGDLINVEGTLASGADTLLINAASVRDLSLNVEGKTISGTVKTINHDANTLTLTDKKLGTITVVPPDTITKGARTIVPAELAVGDNVLSASGTFDYSTKIFSASAMEIYQTKSVFVAQNFQGTLQSLSGAALPVSAVVTVGTKDYTVYFAAGTSVMSKNKAATSLQRFTVGDIVRFYGSIRPTNLSEIDATALRNLNF